MAKHNNVFSQIKKIRPLAAVGIFLSILVVLCIFGCAVYINFFQNKTSGYRIGNKYYGFILQAPKNWTAEGKTLYSEQNIVQILAECNNDKSAVSPSYEIGRFRFKSQKYPQGFGDAGYFPAGFSNGAILDIAVKCVPPGIADKTINYDFSNFKVGGEKAFSEFLNLPVFGKTKYLSFLHNNFLYIVNEYSLKGDYFETMDKIISSLKFVK